MKKYEKTANGKRRGKKIRKKYEKKKQTKKGGETKYEKNTKKYEKQANKKRRRKKYEKHTKKIRKKYEMPRVQPCKPRLQAALNRTPKSTCRNRICLYLHFQVVFFLISNLIFSCFFLRCILFVFSNRIFFLFFFYFYLFYVTLVIG